MNIDACPRPDRTAPLGWNRMCTALLVALTLLGAPALAGQEASTGDLAQIVRGRIEAIRTLGTGRASGEAVLARQALVRFYEERAFEPAWSGTGGDARLDALVEALERLRDHGMAPEDYHLERIGSLRERPALDGAGQVDLDLLATDAFLLAGSHLLHGRVNPESIEPEWLANRRSARMDSVLASVVSAPGIGNTLFGLAPQQPRYARLVEAARRMRAVQAQGGWTVVPDTETLEEGDSSPVVPILRDRLRQSGDFSVAASRSEVFDSPLAEAVRRFQTRHGLESDGVVGRATRAALNVPAGDRARRIEINLERWRWLPADLGSRHIEVNIAGFYAQVVEDGVVARTHRAVVGRQYRETPMFTGSMTYLVLAPYWHVPPTIAAVDKLPLIKADPGYLGAQNMMLLQQSTNTPVDRASVDWASMDGRTFNRQYRIRQDPGPWNALGSVKFMFPNRHNVYLHDTPSRELFSRAARSFSSGCIRIENPLDLAEYLLADQAQWTPDAIRTAAGRSAEQTVRLTRPVPVHLLYWTAWADSDGTLHFRDDIYGRDETVARALNSDPPGS